MWLGRIQQVNGFFWNETGNQTVWSVWTSKLKEPLWSAVFVESRAMTSLTAWFPCKSDVGGNSPFHHHHHHYTHHQHHRLTGCQCHHPLYCCHHHRYKIERVRFMILLYSLKFDEVFECTVCGCNCHLMSGLCVTCWCQCRWWFAAKDWYF